MEGSLLSEETLLIKITGLLDTYNSADFGSAVHNAVQEVPQIKNLVFDMAGVNYISSSGIGMIVNVFVQSNKKDVDVYLLNITDKVREVFQLLGFISMFKLISDVSEIGKEKQPDFPRVISCPGCDKQLKVLKPGKYKCPSCQTSIRIGKDGSVEEL